MDKKEIILVSVGIVSLVGLYLFLKKRKTKTTANIKSGSMSTAPTNLPNKGTVDSNNWDGQGGFIRSLADGSARYYYQDGSLAGTTDKLGNFTAYNPVNT